jgi:hypothetical protein
VGLHIDAVLHGERLDGRRKRLHVLTSPAAGLPDGAMVLQDGIAHLVLGRLARPLVVSLLRCTRDTSG